ncbi:MAG: serine/threonine-protein kinase, partial [bacterium]
MKMQELDTHLIQSGQSDQPSNQSSLGDCRRLLGSRVAHYRITAKLGQGGMGIVYRAEDQRLQRAVALKFLPPELTGDLEARRRFIREARTVSFLDHPNICTIYEIGKGSDGSIYLAMPCYEGETLRSKLLRGPLEVARARQVASGLAAGLAKAHTEGIIHRDIKPANTFVTNDGQVKILDFGVAKLT